MVNLRRIVCRRFGASICLGAMSPRCKNDRGIAESVKERQRGVAGRRGTVFNSFPTIRSKIAAGPCPSMH
ncbi:hypothetical protein PspR32_24180 [Pseudomonas sp. R32]|nr:hypothetical protein [Pseudomonas donghuensis]PJY97983.1 hypothetical protein COO64_00120 [Pseudomonas donghuensis]QHF30722.1 hypothetical protein PspR32_24180 [Pseudomonas sp. R32]